MPNKTKVCIVIALVTTLGLTGCGKAPNTTANDPINAATFDVLNQKDFDVLLKPVCKSATRTFNKITKNAKLNGALAFARKSDNWSARQAAKYVGKLEKNQELVHNAMGKINNSISALLKPTFVEAIKTSKKIETNLRESFLKKHSQDLFLESLQVCNIYNSYFQAKVAFDAYDYRLTAAQTNADNAPWYPAGFTETAGGDVAYKWVHSGSCNIGDSCWHVKFIALDGCSGGLYAEINILDGAGNIIDWTNATASSLGSEDSAILEFSTFNSDAHSAEMSTINCH